MRAKDGEARQLQDLAEAKQELDRLANENAILKQGVRIQAATVERARAEQQQTEEQRTMLAAAADIRTLEAANHGLRVQLSRCRPTAALCITLAMGSRMTADGIPRGGRGRAVH